VDLSLAEARRLALSAQGFGAARPSTPSMAHVRKTAAKVAGFQIDSINVLIRAHYLPAFTRLGPYRTKVIDTLAYERHELFEGWGHAACLFPIEMYPLLRYRMDIVREAGPWTPDGSKPVDAFVRKVYEEVGDRGPLAAGDLKDGGPTRGKWWGWSNGKRALEFLLAGGLVAVAGRRGFTRLYDVTERVIPREWLDAPSPSPDDSRKELLLLAARSLGVAGAEELLWFIGIDQSRAERPMRKDGTRARSVGRRSIAELEEDGRLVKVNVEGWAKPAYVPAGTRVKHPGSIAALLGPFDPLLRRDTQRLFGFERHLAQQLYVPAGRRKYGYYVLPFLIDDSIVARVDLKADRENRALLVQSAHLEPGQLAKRVVPLLADELERMRTWLELETIVVADRGDLAPKLRTATRTRRSASPSAARSSSRANPSSRS
jgi:hypothetical protein